MAKRFILRDLEREHGKPMTEVIPPLVNSGGQQHAAAVLGVTMSTICKWLKDNGYEKVIRYERLPHDLSQYTESELAGAIEAGYVEFVDGECRLTEAGRSFFVPQEAVS